MAVVFIMDFAGGTTEHYDAVLEKMGLGDRLPAGALFHAAGVNVVASLMIGRAASPTNCG